eukprot:6277770-Prymnesium_polylepis.1
MRARAVYIHSASLGCTARAMAQGAERFGRAWQLEDPVIKVLVNAYPTPAPKEDLYDMARTDLAAKQESLDQLSIPERAVEGCLKSRSVVARSGDTQWTEADAMEIEIAAYAHAELTLKRRAPFAEMVTACEVHGWAEATTRDDSREGDFRHTLELFRQVAQVSPRCVTLYNQEKRDALGLQLIEKVSPSERERQVGDLLRGDLQTQASACVRDVWSVARHFSELCDAKELAKLRHDRLGAATQAYAACMSTDSVALLLSWDPSERREQWTELISRMELAPRLELLLGVSVWRGKERGRLSR